MSNLKSGQAQTNLEAFCRENTGEKLSDESFVNYFRVGCSDCTKPESRSADFPRTEFLVHRNPANLVLPTDMNCLAAMQMAVEIQKTENIVVCGHYDCQSVRAAIGGSSLSILGNWLSSVSKVAAKHKNLLSRAASQSEFFDCLCELNVIEQAVNACRTTIIAEAWKCGQALTVHALIDNRRDGLLRDLSFSVAASEEISAKYEAAIAGVEQNYFPK